MTDTLINSTLGLLFVAIAVVLTFLMFNAWKYPFDHQKLRSEAPRWMVHLHRWLGFVYVLIYVYLMWQMVPRLWDYQIELPARTVMHLTVGMALGAVLVTKLAVVRFFRHLEAKLVPFLGTALLIGSMLLTFLALPFSLREIYLSESVLDTKSMTNERIDRVREQLPKAGIEDERLIQRLASAAGLEVGRRVLTSKCTQCHDLRTVLARPRPPSAWRQTVARMANRSTVLNPITESDQLAVTAYLIAVSPTLQKTLKQRRELQMEGVRSQRAISKAREAMRRGNWQFELESARQTFEATCSQCHSSEQVEVKPPASFDEVVVLVQRMVGNGLIASEKELYGIIYYLTETYAGGDFDTAPDSSDESLAPDTNDEKRGVARSNSGGSTRTSQSDVEGELLFQRKACITCHGPKGRSPIGANIPKLAGQNQTYLVRQLMDIKSGARNNGLTSQMTGVLANVNETEVAALAEYLSGLRWSTP